MEDIVAVEVRLQTGENRYFLTWGRIQDTVDPGPLAAVVLDQCRGFDLGGVPASARVRWSLHPASHEPYFYECFLSMCQRSIPFGPRYQAWRRATDKAMREGRELYYLGYWRSLEEPDEPHTVATT